MFEKTKTHTMVVSNKNALAFDPTGIVMGGHEVEQLEELKLMSYIFDEALSWGPMIDCLRLWCFEERTKDGERQKNDVRIF